MACGAPHAYRVGNATVACPIAHFSPRWFSAELEILAGMVGVGSHGGYTGKLPGPASSLLCLDVYGIMVHD